jgi:alanyl-tRNA synthetase
MHSLAPQEPGVRRFETTVERVDGTELVTAETYFYPEGGGQPADRGVLAGREVRDVQTVDGEVVHRLADAPAVDHGETVTGEVDDEFRTYCMRAHTAAHTLYGAGRRLFEELGYGGFDISAERVRVDLATGDTVGDDTLVELERLTNRAVWDSRPVTWTQRPREAVLDDPAVATTTTEAVADNETVRVVEVEGWDTAVCGGTHVANTREVGPVTVLSRSNPGEGLTRVEFAVGPTAIEGRATEARAARTAAAALDSPVAELPAAVQSLRADREELTEQVRDLREQVIEARLADLEAATVEREGVAWLAGQVPTTDANALAEFADRLVEQTADVVALVGAEGGSVAVVTDGTVSATAVVEELTESFGGGGGGSERRAQAGGFDADPEELVAFLRE